MINLVRGQINTIIVTLTEKSTDVDSPPYLFVAKNKETNDWTSCYLLNDSSTKKYRYNQFLLEENNDPDRHSNEITLQSGEYIYEIYQAPEVAGFAPDNMTLVEIGCLMVSSLLTDTEYENESLTNTTYIG